MSHRADHLSVNKHYSCWSIYSCKSHGQYATLCEKYGLYCDWV